MNRSLTLFKFFLVGLLIGAFIIFGTFQLFPNLVQSDHKSTEERPNKPRYWVAPMDPNYKRDKPGKSPMGMDLIPVYGSDSGEQSDQVGTVSISSFVSNNLGVRTAKVERRIFQDTLSTVGYVQYDENKLVHIHPRVSGWIENLFIKAAGDPVSKGQALYEVYSPELVNAQEELLIALERKNDSLITAATSRLRALQIPESAIDQLIKVRRVNNRVTFYSPQDGVVDSLNMREGMFVKPGNTLLSIGDLSTVWVEAEVFERQANHIRVGDSMTMTLDYIPGKIWKSVVSYVYPTLDPNNRTLKVRAEFENLDKILKPNMFAQLNLQSQNSGLRLVVPREAVIRTGQQDRIVLALQSGQFKSIAVTLGRKSADYIEVIDGLNEGDQVVSSAQFLIDSESSKTSDFKRISSAEVSDSESVWTTITITSLFNNAHKVDVEHEAIGQWHWPAMRMEFDVREDIDISGLRVGQILDAKITKDSHGNFVITKLTNQNELKSREDGSDNELQENNTDHTHSVHHGH